jgi:hypothetical protein
MDNQEFWLILGFMAASFSMLVRSSILRERRMQRVRKIILRRLD